jgi:hypothetical protein
MKKKIFLISKVMLSRPGLTCRLWRFGGPPFFSASVNLESNTAEQIC